MDAQEYKQLLSKLGIKPQKYLGQNFLTDETVLDRMIDAAAVSASDEVLEVGPGLGVLTLALAKKAKRVVCVEKDKSLKGVLTTRLEEVSNAQVLYMDALDFKPELASLGKYKVVANVPYYITAPLLNKLLNFHPLPLSLTLLLQKEVAENLARREGVANLLALAVKLRGTVDFVCKVPASSFYPAPKVDSAVVHIELYRKSLVEPGVEKLVFRVAKALFSGKRKQIHNTLSANLRLPKVKVEEMLDQAGLTGLERPEHLEVKDFITLARLC